MEAVGNAVIVTLVVVVALHPAAFVTMTVYVPDAAVLALLIEGVTDDDVNPFGPVQLYVLPPVAVRFKVAPAHCGVLLLADGIGNALMVTLVVVVAEHPFPFVTMTV
jgi:hypothetical protein